MRRSVLAFALLAFAPGLVACGEGGDGGGGKAAIEAAEIEKVIRASATNDDPASCERLHTQRFLERMTGLKDSAAVEACEELVGDESLSEPPESVSIDEVEVDDDAATAEVGFVGSTLDGQIVEIALVVTEGDWKLDALTRFVRLDRPKLIDRTGDDIRAFIDDLPLPQEELVGCLVDALEALDDEELEAIAIGGDPSQTSRIAEVCVRQIQTSQSL